MYIEDLPQNTAGDDVTLTLYNVALTLQKPCLHNNKFTCSKTNGENEDDVVVVLVENT